jgi:DeoR family glycerol-3-phosphate regulon repressor
MVQVAGFGEVDTLFTDQAPPEPFPALLADAGVQCEVAA